MANPNLNKKQSATQANQILEYMMQGNSITPLEALNLFNSMRLSAVIFTLRERGYIIQTERIQVPSGKFVSKYWINPEDRKDTTKI